MLLGAWLCYLQCGFSWKCGHTFFGKKEPFLILHANLIGIHLIVTDMYNALLNVLCGYEEMIISLWITLVVYAFTVITS